MTTAQALFSIVGSEQHLWPYITAFFKRVPLSPGPQPQFSAGVLSGSLCLLGATAAKTRPHGIAFVEAVRVPEGLSSPAQLPADGLLANPSLVLLDTPGILGAAGALGEGEALEALEAWRLKQAELCLVKWLGEGAAQGDGVLLT